MSTEPVWQPHRHWPLSRLPRRYRGWLLDRASLTQRILNACHGRFRVDVIAQRWAHPMRNEARALGLNSGSSALVREVCLRCNEVAWVYARTVIPRATLTGATRQLARLRSRSLGAFLFADPTLRRGRTEIARLTSRDSLYDLATQALTAPPDVLWGRRTRFTVRGKVLLVSEIFLPAIPDFPDGSGVAAKIQ